MSEPFESLTTEKQTMRIGGSASPLFPETHRGQATLPFAALQINQDKL